MGLINSQVRLGDSISIYNRDCFRHINRKGLGVVPGMDTPMAPVNALEAGGFAVGTGLVIGGIFVRGPGGTVMSIFGGMMAGVSLISVLMGMLTSQLSQAQEINAANAAAAAAVQRQPATAPALAPPAPPPRMSRGQAIQSYATAIGPAALSILSKLI